MLQTPLKNLLLCASFSLFFSRSLDLKHFEKNGTSDMLSEPIVVRSVNRHLLSTFRRGHMDIWPPFYSSVQNGQELWTLQSPRFTLSPGQYPGWVSSPSALGSHFLGTGSDSQTQTVEKISSIQVPVELTVSILINFLTTVPAHLLVVHGVWMLSQASVVLDCCWTETTVYLWGTVSTWEKTLPGNSWSPVTQGRVAYTARSFRGETGPLSPIDPLDILFLPAVIA